MRDARARVPELDGLRGLAVAAVVAFHAWPDAVPGGWLGVSLFFTLSGYLITGIVLRDHAPTRASMADFWLRRARRLLPAALLTIAGVLIATALVDGSALRRVAGDALASTLYVQNWREAAAPGGYDAIFDAGLRPLAHMWSLAIEEQVYVVLPVVTLWFGPRRMLLGGTALAAAGTAVWWGSPDAYYATPVRLVEVLAGAALAWWVAEGRRLRIPAGVASVAGAALVVAVASLEESSPWVARGGLAVAALCSALVVGAVLAAEITPLRLRPLTWLGSRSYAIYLVHWPLLVLSDLAPSVVVVVTLVVAEASHHLVEWPIRTGRRLQRRPALGFAVVSMVVAVGAAGAWALAPRPVSDADVAAATASALVGAASVAAPGPADHPSADPVHVTDDGGPGVARAVGSPPPTTAVVANEDDRIPVPSSPRVMLLGDSTAQAIEPAVKGWLGVVSGAYVDGAVDHCSPVFTPEEYRWWSTRLLGAPPAEPCRAAVPADVDLVIVVDHGMPLFDHFDHRRDAWTDITDASFRATIERLYRATIAEAASAGARVVFTTPPTPRIVFHSATEPERRSLYLDLVADLAASDDRVDVVDLGTAVDADPERYPRGDGLHLDGDTGAVNVVVDLLAPAFRGEA